MSIISQLKNTLYVKAEENGFAPSCWCLSLSLLAVSSHSPQLAPSHYRLGRKGKNLKSTALHFIKQSPAETLSDCKPSTSRFPSTVLPRPLSMTPCCPSCWWCQWQMTWVVCPLLPSWEAHVHLMADGGRTGK